MLWSITLSVVLVVAAWLHWLYKNRRLLKISRNFPGPKTVPFFGNALMFICRPDEFASVIKNLISEYGDTLRFWLGPDLNFVVSNPDDLKVLLSSTKASVKGPQYKYMADVIGGGILSGSGPIWRKHRKIATPNYGKRAIQSYGDIFNRELDHLLRRMRLLPMGEMLDIYYHIVRATSYTVCQTLMGLTREQTLNLPHLDEVISTTPRMYDIIFERMTKWYYQIDPIFWSSSKNRHLNTFKRILVDFSRAIVQFRIGYLNSLSDTEKHKLMDPEDDSLSNTKLSVIDRFILSQDLDPDELIRETFTVFTSSQEASAKISSGLLLMMAFHPECQAKLYAEIITVMGDDDRDVTDEDLKNMVYLDMAFKEVLRLFPIGSMLQRSIEEDITISTGTLPAGSSLVAPIFHMQRDPRYWNDPDAFDPERFTPENCKKRPPNCYLPFSVGPMDCLGRYFGTKLIKTACVKVLREYEVSSSQNYKDLKLSIAISTSPLQSYQLILNPRK